MIYLARLFFLIGSCLMAVGVGAFAFKVLFEKDIPEAYQGYWLEILGVVGVAFVLTILAQLMGNDIAGSNRKMVNRATEEEYKRFERANIWDKSIILDTYHCVFINIQGGLRVLSAFLAGGRN
jgi:hypothetical protein